MMVLVVGGSGSGKSEYAEKTADLLFGECLEESMENSKESSVVELSVSRDAALQNAGKYYLATMQIFDEEGRKKVERHRRLRDGKGFVTLEQATDINRTLDKMYAGKRIVLLECMSNLVANEMFSRTKEKSRLGEEAGTREDAENCPAVGAAPKTESQAESQVKSKTESQIESKTESKVVDKILQEVRELADGTTHLVIVTNNVFEDGVCYDEPTMAYLRVMGRVNRELARMADRVIEVVVGIPITIKEHGGSICGS